jgi:zinc D-Ala-D-Ala dipeptidase
MFSAECPESLLNCRGVHQNGVKTFNLTIRAAVLIITFAWIVFAQSGPPIEKNKREADLVELVKLDKSILLDIRYARADNFVGRSVYTEARAFLQRPAAEALLRAHRKLKKEGLGLVIFDGYRPWSVTKLFWEVTPEDKRKFVANPKTGSRHNRGCAVDLSVYDLKSGEFLEMPSDFDEFTERASPSYSGGTEAERKNRDHLRKLMEAEGFTVNANEWWHFDYKDWEKYAIYDIPFSEAAGKEKKATVRKK